MKLEDAVKARLAKICAKEESEQANLEAKKVVIAGLMADYINHNLGIEVDPNELSVEVERAPVGKSYVYEVGFNHLEMKSAFGANTGRVVCNSVRLIGWPEHPRLSISVRAWQATTGISEAYQIFEFEDLADAILYATGEIE